MKQNIRLNTRLIFGIMRGLWELGRTDETTDSGFSAQCLSRAAPIEQNDRQL